MERACRICLEEGAELPIFLDDKYCADDIRTKISVCLQDEIQYVEEYPKNICKMCNSTLDVIYNFINTYKENSNILKESLEAKIKQQVIDNDELLDQADVESESDMTLATIKQECVVDYEDSIEDIFIELVKEERFDGEKPIKKKIKLKKAKEKILKSKIRKVPQAKTNNIASSILEGVYSWTDAQWSYCTGTSSIEENPAIKEKLRVIRKKMRIKKERKKKKIKASTEKLCDTCGMVFKLQHKLKNHILKFHPTETFKCPFEKCNKVCNTKYNLDRHYKRRHGDRSERNFICSVCGRAFTFKTELTQHAKQHNRAKYPKKIFSCKFCDKTYKCQKSVDIHERSVHTGLRPAICSVCDSAFYHEDYLKEHMRLHTGETPFKCPICGRGYAQRGNMKSHLRIHRFSELDEATRLSIRPNYLKLLKF